MNSKILIILEYQILFEILNEIKENLNFKIIKSNKHELNQIKFDEYSNYLTIASKKHNDFANLYLSRLADFIIS